MVANDMDQSLLFTAGFVAAIFALPLFLAWLDQPHDVRAAISSATGRLTGWLTSRDACPEDRE